MLCDCCVRIKMQLTRDDLLVDERERLLKENDMHLDVAVDRPMSYHFKLCQRFCQETHP